jgi:prepilin-type N-terminal cleavage/methylation domain-containing protein
MAAHRHVRRRGTGAGLLGFTLVELLIVILLISIFLTFASVNWNVGKKTGKQALLEGFSIETALLREEAVSRYEDRLIEFDITNNEAHTGRLDPKTGFVRDRNLTMPEEFRVKDMVVNGQQFSQGKCYMTFYTSGMVDRAVLHIESSDSGMYSLLVNPLTGKVSGEDGYIQEIAVNGRNNPS